jgi:diguanylate cyclase (GGDEF)-like protein
VLEDPSAAATLVQVRARDDRFRDAPSASPNFHITASAFWFRLPVRNERDRPAALFLAVRHPTLDELTLHVLGAGGRHEVVRTGDRIAARDRPYPGAMLVLPFDLGARESAELYLRVRAEAAVMLVPLELLDEAALRADMLDERLLHGAMLGLFAALFVYNLLVLLLLREPAYFSYVAFLPFTYLAASSVDGFGSAVLYPWTTWPGNEGLVVFSGLAFALILLFTRSFLGTREFRPLDRSLKGLIAANALLAVSPFVLPVGVAYQLDVAMTFAIPAVGIAAGVVAWRKGRKEARFYVLGQTASWVGLVGFGVMISGGLPFHLYLFEGVGLGVAADALMLALALADKIRILQRAKLRAEEAAVKNLAVQHEALEALVAARTAELEEARRRAELLATTDPLTGVLNRRGLLARAERDLKLALRSGHPLAVVLFDIDHFKRINDTYGHAEGDRVLCQLATAVRGALRSTDLFGRIGGEEFLVVMPHTTGQAAARVAERARRRIEQVVAVGHPPVPVTASFGVAWLSERRGDLDRLQSAADRALYRAKSNGRNRVELGVEIA